MTVADVVWTATLDDRYHCEVVNQFQTLTLSVRDSTTDWLVLEEHLASNVSSAYCANAEEISLWQVMCMEATHDQN
jgi:hypothetical protein